MSSPASFLLRAAALPLLALACAAAANARRKYPLPWREDWSRHVERRALTAGIPLAGLPTVRRAAETGDALLLDARHPDAYRYGRIPGARSLPMERVMEGRAVFELDADPERPIITYCSGIACSEGLELAEWLRRVGYRKVAVFAGGWSEWKAAGGAVEKDP